MSQTPAGWYPQGDGERYWDGTQWTDQTRPTSGPGGAPPPAAHGQAGAPPKKKHTVRNVLLVLVLLLILIVGGCFAIFGAAVNEADKAINNETKNDTPTVVEEGAAFDHDGFAVAKGWNVKADQFGGATISGMKVTLKDDQGQTSGRTALLTFRLYQGKTVVSEIMCSGNSVQEGETTKMDCSSMDSGKLGKWDTIKVADTF